MNLRSGLVAGAWVLVMCAAASAQCVTVARDVCVRERKYNAPPNEQPFFGFVAKTPAMIEADQKFLAAVPPPGADRKRWVDRALQVGWEAFLKGDYVTAGRRFNQAFLLDPRDSGVYHSFAVIAQARFNDMDYADELFRVAKTLPNPLRMLHSDHGRLLLLMRRPQDALPALEQGVKDAPESATGWANLASARIATGDRSGACAAAAEAGKRAASDAQLQSGMQDFERRAGCK